MRMEFKHEVMTEGANSLNAGVEDILMPDNEVGEMIYFFDHETIRQAQIRNIDGTEFTLLDDVGYVYLATTWRYSDELGPVLISKGSMENKVRNGYNDHRKALNKSKTKQSFKVPDVVVDDYIIAYRAVPA